MAERWIGVGVDLVELRRFSARLEAGFRRKVFTAAEEVYCREGADPALRYAGLFAVKEAFMKALGSGIRQGVWYRQIEAPSGPRDGLSLNGRAAEILSARGGGKIRAEISGIPGYAIGTVILVPGGQGMEEWTIPAPGSPGFRDRGCRWADRRSKGRPRL